MNINQICAQFQISKQAHYQKLHREIQKEVLINNENEATGGGN
jgi:hypothetical protein